MSLSACNAVVNPSFESGVLYPWVPSAVNVAKVSTGTNAYGGEYYLNLQTSVGGRTNSISQTLDHLTPHAEYDFNVGVQAVSTGASYCSLYVFMGHNSTTGEIKDSILFNFGEWTSLSGTFVPKKSTQTLTLIAGCDFEDSSLIGSVLLDDVSFTKAGQCGSA
ncbi:hypothetical protein N7495_007816 [Penicillium taxi]|uniref:uncharacterized protein n=1 Tax=Penicillium taxi TaxID=168475 RepID=UPI00254583CF|nr:uncharacterized protein N7495_007816 [Penicillium taxi]KAJ5887775.1 hypothetical protein N7495_007816 [Penicillium taxi]